MTREIEFRAWDSLNRKMIYDITQTKQFSNIDGGYDIIGFDSYLDDGSDTVIMQYTGLKDKNGKKIFEGDIVKSKNGDLFIINEFSGSFGASSIKNDLIWHGCSTVSFAKQEFVIVGNIDENPELLY